MSCQVLEIEVAKLQARTDLSGFRTEMLAAMARLEEHDSLKLELMKQQARWRSRRTR